MFNLNFKKIIYVILHVFMICTLGFSLMIYTSLYKFSPWYEPAGTQFLAILILSAPALLIIGISLILLNKKYKLSRKNILLPFYALAGLCLPLIIDGSLSEITLFIGAALCIVFILKTLFEVFNNIRKLDMDLQ